MSSGRIKFYRYLSVFLVVNILAELISPTVALALTSGPTQPEVESFEPVGTSEMVDAFTGDFNYNIPLITVPGPNGGYPINLAYHAGISMEQEASWVGLGWNINPGEITRQMRGIPDDFSGEKITKTQTQKPNVTVGVGFGMDNEVVGFQYRPPFSGNVYYNNYKGLGFSVSAQGQTGTKSGFMQKVKKVTKNKLNFFGINFKMDSQGGTSLQPSVSAFNFGKNGKRSIEASVGFSSRHGLNTFNFQMRKSGKDRSLWAVNKEQTGGELITYSSGGSSLGMTFAGSDYTPGSSTSMYGYSGNFAFSWGTAHAATYKGTTVKANVSYEGISNKTVDYPAFGYNYSQNRNNAEDNAMLDFNRANEYPVTQSTPALPVPVFTHDVYMIKGQGIGGAFRPHRSDLGVLYDPKSTSNFGGLNANVEVGATPPIGLHVAIEADVNYSHSYSGKWKAGDEEVYDNCKFLPSDNNSGTKEPYYYRASGERTADSDLEDEAGRFSGKTLNSFNVDMPYFEDVWPSFRPKAYNSDPNTNATVVSSNFRSHRAKRIQAIEEKLRREIFYHQNYSNRPAHIYTGANGTWAAISSNSSTTDTYDQYSFDVSGAYSGHHTGSINVVNPDGNRYEYALPAYNTKQRDVVFATNNAQQLGASDYYKTKITAYDAADASASNTDGTDHFYSSTETPAYSHCFLLTAIYSPDYVDLTGDGPSTDDLGYFVKMNYYKKADAADPFKWRAPIAGANLNKGFYSNKNDDKGVYTYGEKELYYVHSIETKTHVAVFSLSERRDGFGVNGPEQTTVTPSLGTKALQKLDKITLYSKKNLSLPIKVVNFEYNYSLCPGVPNNSGVAETYNGANINQNKGKLTLKKVWFEYLGNSKGRLSPYVFDYDESNTEANPSFTLGQMDRWGNFKRDNNYSAAYNFENQDNPYTIQENATSTANLNRTEVDKYHGVWNLKKITLPSGGLISVEYEADDYAFVQDKQAMQMYKILAVGKPTDSPSTVLSNIQSGKGLLSDNTNDYTAIYVAAERNEANPAKPYDNTDIQRYISGINHMYFKIYTKLKKKPDFSAVARDYVEGYAEVDDTQCGFVDTNADGIAETVKIVVKLVKIKRMVNKVHPFRKAAWEYIKNQRPDLLYPTDLVTDVQSIGKSFIMNLVSMVKDVVPLITGYYRSCKVYGYARELDLSSGDTRPSFIRLNTPDKIKAGGGHRVKTIKVSDNWNAMTTNAGGAEASSDYGQTYSYRLADGTSSGVAEYEPLVGGDEIPHHLPSDMYKSRDFLFASPDLYLVQPYGEQYFPAPGVGYSSVTVKSLGSTNLNKKTASGITINEFYTAKDFPVLVEQTEVAACKFSPTINIPGIGSVDIDNKGYSQGYLIQLNDMHGKQKSVSTYPYQANMSSFNTPPVSKVEYLYNTDSQGKLSSTVSVLDNDGSVRQGKLGETSEMLVDMIEHSNFYLSAGAAANIDVPVFSIWPSFSYSHAMHRSVVNVKLVNKVGTLVRTQATQDGTLITTNNLLFDSETGQPLYTSVTNNFDEPVYTYNYAAHWYYPGMKAAYRNIGARYSFSGITQNTSQEYLFNGLPHAECFMRGDEVLINTGSLFAPSYRTYWVSVANSALVNGSYNYNVKFIDETGTPLTNTNNPVDLKIVHSGFRNQQSASSGKLVTLQDMFNISGGNANANSSFFQMINSDLDAGLPVFNGAMRSGNLCNVGICEYGCIYLNNTTSPPVTNIRLVKSCNPNSGSFIVNVQGISYSTMTDLSKLRFYYSPSQGVYVKNISTGTTYNCLVDGSGVLTPAVLAILTPSCFNPYSRILHAEAYTFSDNWSNMNYTDAGSPMVNGTTTLASRATLNPYRYGTLGIWRNWQKYLYHVDRLQAQGNSPTNIAKDGEYRTFVPFKWLNLSGNNTWSFVSEVTRYNPYGYELENKDALGLYSSAMYGYDNSVVTAVSANCPYFEMAFDGFEDYTNNTYGSFGHGHAYFSGGVSVNTTNAHSGSKSLGIPVSGATLALSTTTQNTYFTNSNTKKYLISAWFKQKAGATPNISITAGVGTTITPGSLVLGPVVEGWQKVELTGFLINGANANISFTGADVIDDVRIQPMESSLTTYVYDPITLKLLAELDNRNFATFYNYDQEGSLVQVKKETEKGVMTIKTTRNNIKRIP